VTVTPGPSAALSCDADRRADRGCWPGTADIFPGCPARPGLLNSTRHLDRRTSAGACDRPLSGRCRSLAILAHSARSKSPNRHCGESLRAMIVGRFETVWDCILGRRGRWPKQRLRRAKKVQNEASAKVERKSAAKRTTAKKVKSKVRRAGGVARRSMTKKQRAPKVAATEASRKTLNQVVEAPVEDTSCTVPEPLGDRAVVDHPLVRNYSFHSANQTVLFEGRLYAPIELIKCAGQ
jgi:hypothetical protein